MSVRARGFVVAGILALAALFLLAGCGGAGGGDGRPRVVVTTTVLGAVVQDAVGGAAQVETIIPNGADPHEFQPSARQVADIGHADLVVRDGANLEQGLRSALDQAAADGVPVVSATDLVPVRRVGGQVDPHIWTDPLTMRDLTLALVAPMRARLGIDIGVTARRAAAALERLDREVATILAPIPPSRRRLVTGHESMGYFAARYHLTVVGELIPSLSSQAQPSAAALADLAGRIRAEGVPAIFIETNSPSSLAQAVADQAGVRVIRLDVTGLPPSGGYADFARALAEGVRGGLTGGG